MPAATILVRRSVRIPWRKGLCAPVPLLQLPTKNPLLDSHVQGTVSLVEHKTMNWYYTAPYSLVTGKLVENLEATAKGGFSVFPVPPNMHWTPAMPPAYTIQPEYLDKLNLK